MQLRNKFFIMCVNVNLKKLQYIKMFQYNIRGQITKREKFNDIKK
jgi:hypothetical protein